MKPSLEQIREVCTALGWVEVIPQNNPHMISFRDAEFESWRVNVYFTTMSVTVQNSHEWGMVGNYKNVTLEGLEKIITELQA